VLGGQIDKPDFAHLAPAATAEPGVSKPQSVMAPPKSFPSASARMVAVICRVCVILWWGSAETDRGLTANCDPVRHVAPKTYPAHRNLPFPSKATHEDL
jgi:hypothetical protein